ncbi:hypothetical protein NIES593_15940 [Hydrococcus rivularis NIES-593]|uniref:DNA sulfur modification protein DndE n=1 Tax=Hydrococcus rivularis NIES-593 TaxID=1921803 RepID=A0A1U7HCI8_9CYAN|nr:hypothetical protein [Hydrococcus rivularis]OKH21290.1 hypothetical protein NIES593_15940 [Hydrococcus rivularis NIES-593]
MKRIDPTATIRPTPEANGYLKVLKNNGAFSRMVDAYLFAAAYAIKNNVDVASIPSQGRQDLSNIDIVDDDVRLSLEAGIHAICKRNGRSEPTDSREVMEILTQYAEAGLKLLKQRWEGKVGIQIQDDVRRIINQS